MKKFGIVASVVFIFWGCASTGKVKTDFDPKAQFQSFKTYSFLKPEILNEKDILNNSLVRTRIETLINENLQGKGLSLVEESKNPNLHVRYWVGIKDKQQTQYYSGTYGSSYYGPYWDGRWAPTYDRYVTYEYREGTLIVDLIDPTTKDLVWRAYVQQVLSNKDTSKKNAQINLKKAFQNYPPPSDLKK